jgi:hypothetical protein
MVVPIIAIAISEIVWGTDASSSVAQQKEEDKLTAFP